MKSNAVIMSCLTLVLLACGEDPAAQVCAPGRSVACIGQQACNGFQVCRSDGSGYEACVCGGGGAAGADGGPAGAGGNDGTAPTWICAVSFSAGTSSIISMTGLSDNTLLSIVRHEDEFDEQGTFASIGVDGNPRWQRLLQSGTYAEVVFPASTSGSAFAAGYYKTGAWLAQLDSAGTISRQVMLDASPYPPHITSGTALSDGNLVIAGSFSDEGDQAMTAMVDSDFGVAWALAADPPSDAVAIQLGSVSCAPSSSCFVGGRVWHQNPTDPRIWILAKIEPSGTASWSLSLSAGSASCPDGQVVGVRSASGGGVFMAMECGYSDEDPLVLKLDASGAIAWQRRVVPADASIDSIVKVVGFDVVDDAPVLLITTSWYGAYPAETALVRLDAKGEVVDQRRYRNGQPGPAKLLTHWSDGGWGLAFHRTSITPEESLARVGPTGLIAQSCPEEFGIPAEYATKDVVVNIGDGPVFKSAQILAEAAQSSLEVDTRYVFPAQCGD